MPKHPPRHPMANSLVMRFMEYLINSNNMESHLGIFFQCLIRIFIDRMQSQCHRRQQQLGIHNYHFPLIFVKSFQKGSQTWVSPSTSTLPHSSFFKPINHQLLVSKKFKPNKTKCDIEYCYNTKPVCFFTLFSWFTEK